MHIFLNEIKLNHTSLEISRNYQSGRTSYKIETPLLYELYRKLEAKSRKDFIHLVIIFSEDNIISEKVMLNNSIQAYREGNIALLDLELVSLESITLTGHDKLAYLIEAYNIQID